MLCLLFAPKLLEAKESEVQAKLAAMKQRKENFQMLNEQQQLHHGEGSKALPAQYYHKQDAADNPRARANVHHAGSHYHMAASRQQSHGVKVQGVVARHSSQGDRMQAMRQQKRDGKRNQVAARDVANGQTHSEQKRGAGATSGKRGGKSVNKAANNQMTGK
jgi:hypothetical protein